VSNIELRWLLTHSAAQPRLQFRTCVTRPHWGEWQDVPMVMEALPEPVITVKDLARLPLPEGWKRAEDGRLIPPPGFKGEARTASTDLSDPQ
jgi:hypothetical protein